MATPHLNDVQTNRAPFLLTCASLEIVLGTISSLLKFRTRDWKGTDILGTFPIDLECIRSECGEGRPRAPETGLEWGSDVDWIGRTAECISPTFFAPSSSSSRKWKQSGLKRLVWQAWEREGVGADIHLDKLSRPESHRAGWSTVWRDQHDRDCGGRN